MSGDVSPVAMFNLIITNNKIMIKTMSRSSTDDVEVVMCPASGSPGYYCNSDVCLFLSTILITLIWDGCDIFCHLVCWSWSTQGGVFACMDWTFGSKKIARQEEAFRARTSVSISKSLQPISCFTWLYLKHSLKGSQYLVWIKWCSPISTAKKVVFISDSPSSESDEVTIITPTSQKLSQASLRKKVNKDFLEKRATAKLPKSRVIKKKLNLWIWRLYSYVLCLCTLLSIYWYVWIATWLSSCFYFRISFLSF